MYGVVAVGCCSSALPASTFALRLQHKTALAALHRTCTSMTASLGTAAALPVPAAAVLAAPPVPPGTGKPRWRPTSRSGCTPASDAVEPVSPALKVALAAALPAALLRNCTSTWLGTIEGGGRPLAAAAARVGRAATAAMGSDATEPQHCLMRPQAAPARRRSCRKVVSLASPSPAPSARPGCPSLSRALYPKAHPPSATAAARRTGPGEGAAALVAAPSTALSWLPRRCLLRPDAVGQALPSLRAAAGTDMPRLGGDPWAWSGAGSRGWAACS